MINLPSSCVVYLKNGQTCALLKMEGIVKLTCGGLNCGGLLLKIFKELWETWNKGVHSIILKLIRAPQRQGLNPGETVGTFQFKNYYSHELFSSRTLISLYCSSVHNLHRHVPDPGGPLHGIQIRNYSHKKHSPRTALCGRASNFLCIEFWSHAKIIRNNGFFFTSYKTPVKVFFAVNFLL